MNSLTLTGFIQTSAAVMGFDFMLADDTGTCRQGSGVSSF